MKNKLSLKKATIGILTILVLMGISIQVYSYANGVAGRTLKPGGTNGCTCHQASLNAAVLTSVTGPATLNPGQVGTYSFTVDRSSGTKSTGGIDIATSGGTLGIGTSTGIKISSSEVVHSAKFSTFPMTKTFTLTAPVTPGPITLYCTGACGTNPPNWNNGTSFTINVVSGITPIGEVVNSYSLSQNFPNPFNPTTTISFGIPKAGLVSISVYDITGKFITELVNGELSAGKYNTAWDASSLASGVYFYKIQAGDFVEMKRMTLIK